MIFDQMIKRLTLTFMHLTTNVGHTYDSLASPAMDATTCSPIVCTHPLNAGYMQLCNNLFLFVNDLLDNLLNHFTVVVFVFFLPRDTHFHTTIFIHNPL